jgi:N-acetyl sugar amidotransferase
MDTTDRGIVFDANGVCNHCHSAKKQLDEKTDNQKGFLLLEDAIKNSNGKYNCLIGLSGGVDSSMVLHYAVKFGFKPLCFTIDNGWNSKESDENIMRLVEGLRVPFYRWTIDRKKFLELQGAFIQAGVRNIEIPTDHILMASTYEMAAANGIKHILSGGNWSTESIMPEDWGYQAKDLTHIKDIYKRFTGKKLTGLPMISLLRYLHYRFIRGIKIVNFLDYFDYDRDQAIATLEKEYGWKPYGEKHGESVFTRWFQNFYLYQKFGIDKRKAHLSSMINSGQLTRAQALELLTVAPVYPELKMEKRIMSYPVHEHNEYRTSEFWWKLLSKLYAYIKFR